MATNHDIPIQKLEENLIALEKFSLCLDRTFKHIQYWSHFAYVLNVDTSVINQCRLYLEESPTIKLFEYQSTKRPELTIKNLKDALTAIQRVDIYIMIDKRFKDEDKVCEVITDSLSDIMDKIALRLDSAKKPIGNWENLARELKVSRNTYQKFVMYSDYNPTVALVRYLYTTRKKPILLKEFMDYFRKMERGDVIYEVETSNEFDESKEANKVLKIGSDLLLKIADMLNRKIAGVEGWRELGSHFNVDPSIMDSLEPPHDKAVHSSTTKVINWLAAARPSTTINDVAKALEKIKRYDALKVLRSYFDVDVSFDESNTMGFSNIPDLGYDADSGDGKVDADTGTDDADTGTVDTDTGTDDADTGTDHADTGDNVNRRSATPPNTPEVHPKAPDMFSIPATEQSSSRIFQGDVFTFGLPSKSRHQMIGREEKREELIANLTDKENEMVVLHATPGCGKTTLVVSVAHDITENPNRYTVVYVDSKNVFSVEDLAYKILTTCDITSSQNHPKSQVIDLFSQSKKDCVLILENLDNMYHSIDEKNQTSTSGKASASDQESSCQSTFKKKEFWHFLRDVTKSAPKLKVLVTTWEAVQCLSIKVKQMTLNLLDQDQSLELLQLRSDYKMPMGDKPGLEPIIECCGGIPLLLCAAVIFLSNSDSMEAACEQFASSPPQKQLDYLCPDSLPVEECLNHCLGKCFERMDVCSREVLVLLSVFPNHFTLKEAQHIAEGSKIDKDQLEEGFQALRKFCFLNTHDAKSETRLLHPAIRSFGISKAREEGELKNVFEPARWRFILYTFNILSMIEKEFFSTQSRSAIQKYRLQDDNIREIARWCMTDSNMDIAVKKFCIESFLRSQFVLLKTMRSYLLKLILREFALICQNNEDLNLYCDCLTLCGAKIVYGCLCTPYLCPTALQEADVCFCKVMEALIEDDGKGSQDTQKNIDHIYKCEDISDKGKAQFFLKYGKCLVRHGYDVQGFYSIRKGIDVRQSQDLSNTKDHAMLAMGFEDLAGACSYQREHVAAISIREKHVLPKFCNKLGMHPFTATAYSQLARNYLELGDYDKAVKANDTALSYRKTLLGDHQDTARSLFDKGAILYEQAQAKGDHDQSLQFYENALLCLQEALEMQKRVLDSPRETALTCQELAFVLTQLGRKEEAEQYTKMVEEYLKKSQKMKRTSQDDLPPFSKSTSQERDAVDNSGTEEEPILPNPSGGSSTGSNTCAQVNKSWVAKAKEFIKEKFGLTSGDKIDDLFGEHFALDYQHEVPALGLQETIKLMYPAIGAIIPINFNNKPVLECGATCFRIGSKYVITNKHVIDKINSQAISWINSYVDFNYKEEGQPANRARFTSNPVLIDSEKLDYAILELSLYDGIEGQFPPSLPDLGFNIAPAARQLQGGECLTFIGHPGGKEKQIDVSCPIKHQKDIPQHLLDHAVFHISSNPDYATYDVSTFFEGSSGSPGILLKEKLLVVLQSGGISFQGTNKRYKLEYGILMSSIIKDVMDKIDSGALQGNLDDIFGGATSSTFNQCSEPMDID